MGGQTALNTALALERAGVLEKYGVEMIGARAAAIDMAEDRKLFREAMDRIGLESPRAVIASSPPIRDATRDGSKAVIARIPERPASRPSQVDATSPPSAVTSPSPVVGSTKITRTGRSGSFGLSLTPGLKSFGPGGSAFSPW